MAGQETTKRDSVEELGEFARAAIDHGMAARSNGGGASVAEVMSEALGLRLINTSSLSGRQQSMYDDEDDEEGRSNQGRWHAGSLITRVSRVRFEHLQEDEVLGQGTFGIVVAGTYMEKEVAIKKARAPIHATRALDDFRWVSPRWQE